MKKQLEKAGEQEIFLTELNQLQSGSMNGTQDEFEALEEEHKFEMLR